MAKYKNYPIDGYSKKSPVVESLKELARLIVLAVVPVVVVYLTPVEDKFLWAGIATAALKAVDKFLHTAAPDGSAGGVGF